MSFVLLSSYIPLPLPRLSLYHNRYTPKLHILQHPVYTLNPNSAKLEPNHLGPFKIAAVYDNHTYQLKDAQGNTKKLHHDCLRPCRAIPILRLFVRIFPDFPQTPILVSDNKQGARVCVATKLPDFPANISYNTQGALDESPLDVSNDMD
ncbi:hypothetical protein DSO57_1035550 [Entomophthora muscae]|uniref:Uncharacterized protein n=1 Tax=Entomophthora muscae TaxID=34485 RepID=A0ACC2SNL8_9FUNG|nr:hypothetical protein DSO57_1035550 [Entomophthora muscae]